MGMGGGLAVVAWEGVQDETGETVVNANIQQAATRPPMTTNYDWRSPFSYTLMPNDLVSGGGLSGAFFSVFFFTNTPPFFASATGVLVPETILHAALQQHAEPLQSGHYRDDTRDKLAIQLRRYVVAGATGVSVERPDGQVLTFALNAGVWAGDTDIDVKLTQSGKTWTLTDTDDTVETYTTATTNVGGLAVLYGRLASIKARNGYTQTLSYDANNELLSVTDSYDRSLSFTYAGGLLQTVTTPDGLVLTYGYSGNLLTSVSYSTTPQTNQTYLYENAALPAALTGIIDENGNRFATWTYDAQGRALSSQHGAGADLTTVA